MSQFNSRLVEQQRVLDLRRQLKQRVESGEAEVAQKILKANPNIAGDSETVIELLYSEFAYQEDLGKSPSVEAICGGNEAWRVQLSRVVEVHKAMRDTSTPMTGLPLSLSDTASIGDTVSARTAAPVLEKQVGPYEILSLLGTGGMGTVYKARHRRLNRLVALKVLRDSFVGPGEATRFRNEAELAARLSHPNIVTIYEVGDSPDGRYLALELVDGETLAQRLTHQEISPHGASALIETLAQAIQYAHENGVVHRDLKPSNILIDRQGQPQIADFGLAKNIAYDETSESVELLTLTGEIIGTPAYMSPEQAAGQSQEAGPATDVYSLGAVLYEMLTGRPPFRGTSPIDTLVQIRDFDPIPVRRLNSNISRDLQTICLKCLEKQPSRRYVSAAELASDVHRYLTDQPIQARPASVLYQWHKFTQRNKALVAAAMAAILALVAGIAGTTWKAHDATKQKQLAVAAAESAKQEVNYSHLVTAQLRQLILLAHPLEMGPDVTVRDALKEMARTLDERPPDYPAVEHELRVTLAAGLEGAGQIEDSEFQLRKALDLCEQHSSINGDEARAMLGGIQAFNGDFAAAEENLLAAVDSQREAGDENNLAISLRYLAKLRIKQAKYGEAERLARESLAYFEKLDGIGNTRCMVSSILASALARQGKSDEAEGLYLATIELAQAKLGPDSGIEGACLHALGNLYETQDRFERAFEVQERGIRIALARYDEDHPNVAISRMQFSTTLRMLERYEQAEVELTKAIESLSAKLPPDHPVILNARTRMGSLMESTEQFEKAAEVIEDVLQRKTRSLGRSDYHTTISMLHMARVHQRRGEFEQAIALVNEAIEARNEQFGADDSRTTSARNELLKILADQGVFTTGLFERFIP